jgi:RNA polymerase sigma factor (sigma-70 family)
VLNEFIEKEVIEGCIRNDRRSQEKLYKQFFPALFCLGKRFFQHDHEAIEAVNDGMLKVYKNVGSYRADKGVFFNWVYTIVRNTALDKLKLSVPIPRRSEALSDIAEPGAGDNPLRSLESKDVYKLLDHLPAATRAVCSLFYLEGYSIKDIVEQLQISPGTVKWHLSESRKKLKEVFEKHFNTRP